MIPQGVEIYVSVDPVGMRFGFERSGGIVRERMEREPRSKALFVYIGKRRQTVKILTWDGTGVVLFYKRLDVGLFELPNAKVGAVSAQTSHAQLEALISGIGTRFVH